MLSGLHRAWGGEGASEVIACWDGGLKVSGSSDAHHRLRTAYLDTAALT